MGLFVAPNLKELIVIADNWENLKLLMAACALEQLLLPPAPPSRCLFRTTHSSRSQSTVLFLYVLTVKTGHESSKWIYRTTLVVTRIF